MIKKIKILSDDLHVYFNNERDEIYPNIWLRDHARDEENWDKRSNQRKTFTATLDYKLKIKSAEILDNGKTIKILWPDLQKPVTYSYEFLFNNSLNIKLKTNSLKLWKEKDLNDQIYIDFETVQSNEGYKKFLKILCQYGFSVVQNCKTEISSVENIVNKIGYVRNSIFGGLWSFESNEDKADSAYTKEELRPHTDATYSNDAPGLQLLLCCEYKAKGGDSIMVDGFKIAEMIKKDNKELFDVLSTINVKGSYIGDDVFLEAERPIFNLNSKKELFQVSFNNYDRAPFRFEKDLTIKFYEAIRMFDLMVNSKEYQWRHVLKPGELLIFNNWRVLHGRGSFDGTRKISGCYINKEDFDSSCRMHGIY